LNSSDNPLADAKAALIHSNRAPTPQALRPLSSGGQDKTKDSEQHAQCTILGNKDVKVRPMTSNTLIKKHQTARIVNQAPSFLNVDAKPPKPYRNIAQQKLSNVKRIVAEAIKIDNKENYHTNTK
jgi:hypothetical protein